MTTLLDRSVPSPAGTRPAVSGTARARFAVSLISLLAAGVGLLGLGLGVDAMRIVGLGAYLLFGVGAAPWVLSRRIDLPLRLLLSIGSSLSALLLLSTAMLQLGLWYPTAVASVVLLVTVPLHALGLRAALRELPDGALRRPAVSPALVLAVTGALISLGAALTHRHITPGLWGFLVEIGPVWYVGLLLVVGSLALSRTGGEFTMAVGVLLLMLVLTGTPALVYDGPRSQSASKHVELVEQIRGLHHLTSTVAVYNGWPGYFSAMAWLADVTGIRDPITLATAWPALIGVGRVVALRYLAGQVIADRSTAWLATAFAVLADSVGQDYFSPQSAGFVLGLMIFGLALSRLALWPKVAALTVLGCAVGVGHQLSPYAIGGALCVLVLFRQIRPWWLPATVLAPALGWALLHWQDLRDHVYLSDLGNAANLRPPATVATDGLSRMAVVGYASSALLLGILLLGILAAVTVLRRRRDRAAWALALCPSAGVLIIMVNPYGNEGIFRAALFGIPWLAILAAQVFRSRARRAVSVPILASLLALTSAYAVSSFGLDATNVIRPQDREAFQLFQRSNAGSGQTSYLLVLGPGDLPSSPPAQSRPHVAVKRDAIDDAGFALNTGTAAVIAAELTGSFVDYAGEGTPANHLFAIWSPVSSYYGEEYGIHTATQFAALRDALAGSPSWKVAYSSHGTVLFAYTGG